jgi:hypothetical protein
MLYKEEAAELKDHVGKKIIMKHAFHVGAARIADKLNSGFPRGAHDENVELFTASIAFTMKCGILTSPAQVKVYEDMNCKASDLASWVDEQS